MSHKIFANFGGEVVKIIGILFISLFLIVLLEIFKPNDTLAFDFKSITACIDGSSNSDCIQELPNIKNDIQDLKGKKDFTWGDFGGLLKAVAILAINSFLVIINMITAVLKAILPLLSGS